MKSKTNEQVKQTVVDCFAAALSGGLQGLERFRGELAATTASATTAMEEEVVESPAVPRVEDIAIESPPVAVVAADKDDGVPRSVMNLQLSFRSRPCSIQVMESAYKEFYGFHEKADSIPVEGGFYGLEKLYKAKWRRGYSKADGVFFSAVKRCFQGLHAKAGIDRDAGVGDWNEVAVAAAEYHELLNAGGYERVVEKMQQQGFLVKKTRAKRKRGDETSAVP